MLGQCRWKKRACGRRALKRRVLGNRTESETEQARDWVKLEAARMVKGGEKMGDAEDVEGGILYPAKLDCGEYSFDGSARACDRCTDT